MYSAFHYYEHPEDKYFHLICDKYLCQDDNTDI